MRKTSKKFRGTSVGAVHSRKCATKIAPSADKTASATNPPDRLVVANDPPEYKRNANGDLVLRDGYRYSADGVLIYEEPGREQRRPIGNDLLTLREAAAELRIGLTSVNKLIRKGYLPKAHILDRAVRIRRSSLEQFVKDREAGLYKKRRLR